MEAPDPLTDLDEDLFGPAPPRWRITGAVGWAVAGTLAGGGGCWGGLFFVQHVLGFAVPVHELTDPAPEVVLVIAVVAGVLGAVAGGVARLARGRPAPPRSAGRCALVGAVLGVAGGGLSPLAVFAAAGAIPPEVSASLAWAAVGLVAGVTGYTWGRERVEDLGGGATPERCDASPGTAARGPLASPVGRVLPVVAVSGACLVAAAVGSPSPAGWAVLAVGLLGSGVAWALIGQERRLRELERRLPADRGEAGSAAGGDPPRRDGPVS